MFGRSGMMAAAILDAMSGYGYGGIGVIQPDLIPAMLATHRPTTGRRSYIGGNKKVKRAKQKARRHAQKCARRLARKRK